MVMELTMMNIPSTTFSAKPYSLQSRKERDQTQGLQGWDCSKDRDSALNMTAYFSLFSPCCFSPLHFLLKVFLNILFLFLLKCLSILPTYMPITHHMLAVPTEYTRGSWIPKTGVTDGNRCRVGVNDQTQIY